MGESGLGDPNGLLHGGPGISELAVKGRVSRSTQKQALNALVFLFREALGREAGDLEWLPDLAGRKG
jgi:hypothetical protein